MARRDKRNALNPAMRAELAAFGERLGADETLCCLVVADDGPSFCTSIDLVEDLAGTLAGFAERPLDDETMELALQVAGVFGWIPRLGCPSVAAVRGHAYGAGLQLALACDFRIFSRDARCRVDRDPLRAVARHGGDVSLPRIVGEAGPGS